MAGRSIGLGPLSRVRFRNASMSRDSARRPRGHLIPPEFIVAADSQGKPLAPRSECGRCASGAPLVVARELLDALEADLGRDLRDGLGGMLKKMGRVSDAQLPHPTGGRAASRRLARTNGCAHAHAQEACDGFQGKRLIEHVAELFLCIPPPVPGVGGIDGSGGIRHLDAIP